MAYAAYSIAITLSLPVRCAFYTTFADAIQRMTTSDVGTINDFMAVLQEKLQRKLRGEAVEIAAPEDLVIDEGDV